MNDLEVWVQMFFDDGSVSEGRRIPLKLAYNYETLLEFAETMLYDLNRTEGMLLMWGCGIVNSTYVKIPSSSEESDSSVSDSS